MILSSLNRQELMGRIRTLTTYRPDLRFIRSEGFQDGFIHGLSIIAGAGVGLMVWLVFQTPAAPPSPYAAYHVTVPFTTEVVKPIAEGDKPKVEEPVAHNETHGPEPTGDNAPAKATVPTPGLTEHDIVFGDLPIIRKSDNLRPFDAYRQPFAADQLTRPLIAVAMLDYGLSAQASGSILGVMPPEVNVILSSAARDDTNWSQQAFDHGHELWLELAVEPADYPASDPGKNGLLTAASIEKNLANIKTQLGQAVGYAGVFARDGSPFFTTGADADFLSGAIFSRGLGMMLNTTHVDNVIRSEATREKAPYYAGNMIMLDDIKTADALAAQTSAAENMATNKGFAIVLFHPTRFSQQSVLSWLSTLRGKGYALAPLSVIAERGVELSK